MDKLSNYLYYAETDILEIDLSGQPATGGVMNAGWDGEDEDILLNVNEQDQIVSITIENASKRVDLKLIKSDDGNVRVGKGKGAHSVPSVAEDLGLSRDSVDGIITAMRKAGYNVGYQANPEDLIVLTDEDVDAIKRWRDGHPKGRPVQEKTE